MAGREVTALVRDFHKHHVEMTRLKGRLVDLKQALETTTPLLEGQKVQGVFDIGMTVVALWACDVKKSDCRKKLIEILGSAARAMVGPSFDQ